MTEGREVNRRPSRTWRRTALRWALSLMGVARIHWLLFLFPTLSPFPPFHLGLRLLG